MIQELPYCTSVWPQCITRLHSLRAWSGSERCSASMLVFTRDPMASPSKTVLSALVGMHFLLGISWDLLPLGSLTHICCLLLRFYPFSITNCSRWGLGLVFWRENVCWIILRVGLDQCVYLSAACTLSLPQSPRRHSQGLPLTLLKIQSVGVFPLLS